MEMPASTKASVTPAATIHSWLLRLQAGLRACGEQARSSVIMACIHAAVQVQVQVQTSSKLQSGSCLIWPAFSVASANTTCKCIALCTCKNVSQASPVMYTEGACNPHAAPAGQK